MRAAQAAQVIPSRSSSTTFIGLGRSPSLAAARRHALAERGALGRVERLARERQDRRALAVHVATVEPGEARHLLYGEARLALGDGEQALAQPPPLRVHRLVLAL